MYVHAKLYNPSTLGLPSVRDASYATLRDALQDSRKKLSFIQQHPLMHTFHSTLNHATAVASYILTQEGSISSWPQKMGAIIFAHQMADIFAKHALEMVVEYPVYCEWFGYCNSIAMIGICVKGQKEFYPITYPLWIEDYSWPSLSIPVANLASPRQGSSFQDVPQGKETMPTPWPPIVDSAVAAEAPTTYEYLESGVTIPATLQPFHSCNRCIIDPDEGYPMFFVAPEYVLYCSSLFTPANHRVQDDSFNNICPEFVAKFKNTLSLDLSEYDNMDSKLPSPGSVETRDIASSVGGHQSNSSTSSVSNMDPEFSGIHGEKAKAEEEPFEADQEAYEALKAKQEDAEASANPGITMHPSTAENIDSLTRTIESMANSLSPSERRPASLSVISDGDIELGHAETRPIDCERLNMVHNVELMEDYLSPSARLFSVCAIPDGSVELGHAETRPTCCKRHEMRGVVLPAGHAQTRSAKPVREKHARPEQLWYSAGPRKENTEKNKEKAPGVGHAQRNRKYYKSK